MKTGLSFALMFLIFCNANAPEAFACAESDFICKKFQRMQAKKQSDRRRAANKRRVLRKRRRQTRQRQAARTIQSGTTVNAPVTQSAAPVSQNLSLAAKPPSAVVKPLAAGAIAEAPRSTGQLLFSSSTLMETATANCAPSGPHATRSINCTLAVHRAHLDNEPGAGCSTSLKLSQLIFEKTNEKRWINEEAISICGGRLLRRSELLPLEANGKRVYGLNEEYRMFGGDPACSAPYLESRKPLKRSYFPITKSPALECGRVAAVR